mmetsp:Transcript_20667/g.52729  ORF Transcript_20667/g.52729 Transcript_20667/m.52729 type:complete len:860 (-) Transcript_20667:377-2956(-)
MWRGVLPKTDSRILGSGSLRLHAAEFAAWNAPDLPWFAGLPARGGHVLVALLSRSRSSEEQFRTPRARPTLRAGPLRREAQDLAIGEGAGRLPGAAGAAGGDLTPRLAEERLAVAKRPMVGDAVVRRDEDMVMCAGDGEDLEHAVLAGEVDRARLGPHGALDRLVAAERKDRNPAINASNHRAKGQVLAGLHRSRHGHGFEEGQLRRRDGDAHRLAGGGVRALGDGTRTGHHREARVAPGHATRHAELREAMQHKLRRDACRLAGGRLGWHNGAGAAGRERGARGVRAAREDLWLEHRRPLHGGGHDRADDGARGQAAVATRVHEVVVFSRGQVRGLHLGHAVRQAAGGPGVLADARGADARLGADILGPPHVGLGREAEDVRGPQLLLALGAPALLPGPVAALRRDVRVVLGGDRTGLPAVPLARAGPRRLARLRDEHALAHGALDGAAGKLHQPAQRDSKEQRPGVLPRPHVDVCHGVLTDQAGLAVGGLLGDLLLGLRRRDEVGAVLEGVRQPRRDLAGGAGVEQAAAGLPGLVRRAGAGGLRNGVQAERPEQLHDDDRNAQATGDVDHRDGGLGRVGEGQRDGSHKGASGLNREAASVRGQHVEAEHGPHGGSQASGAHVRAPHHAQLGNVVQSDPVGEGLDEVHHGNQEAHAAVGLGAPVLLLRLAHEFEVLEGLQGAVHTVGARRGLWVLHAVLHLLADPRRVARGEARNAGFQGSLLKASRAAGLLALLHLGLLIQPLQRSLHVGLLQRLGTFVLRLVRRVGAVGHHKREAEHVVEVLLLPRREDLTGRVQLPLRGHRETNFASPELHSHYLCAERRMEDEPRGQRGEAEADAQALEVHSGDENRRPRELQS